MRTGWKTRIDERRYFEEKKQGWRKQCIDNMLAESVLHVRQQEQQSQESAFSAYGNNQFQSGLSQFNKGRNF